MKTKEKDALYRESDEGLQKQLLELRKDLFHFRMQQALGEMKETHVFRQTRRKIAFINTVVHSRSLKSAQQLQTNAVVQAEPAATQENIT